MNPLVYVQGVNVQPSDFTTQTAIIMLSDTGSVFLEIGSPAVWRWKVALPLSVWDELRFRIMKRTREE